MRPPDTPLRILSEVIARCPGLLAEEARDFKDRMEIALDTMVLEALESALDEARDHGENSPYLYEKRPCPRKEPGENNGL